VGRVHTEDELEASIAAAPDDVHEPIDWTRTVPIAKRDIHIRIDEDVLDWFRKAGRPRRSDPDQQRAARLYGEP